MRSLTVGASSALVLLSAALMLQESAGIDAHAPPQTSKSPITGSVQGQIRVPQGIEWQAVRKPVEIMSLQAANLERIPVTYGARRSIRNDREDSLFWQATGPGGMEARIALVRHGPQGGAAPSLFVEMTRQQAERGVAVTRSGTPGLIVTKFGPGRGRRT